MDPVYKMVAQDDQMIQYKSIDGGQTWVGVPTEVPAATSGTPTGTGSGAVAHAWYSSASIIAFLLFALPIATAFLHAYQPSPENAVLVKASLDAIKAAQDALQAGQVGIKADVAKVDTGVAKVDAVIASKTVAPIVVAPQPTASANPLLNLPPEVAQKYLAEYLKAQSEKK